MSRPIPDYASPLTTLAFIWRLDRRDGITLGLTSHDRDLVIGGLIYRAAPGMVPSAIEQDDGFEAERVTLSAALRSDLISAEDLTAGRWDGARLRLSLVDWHDVGAPPLLLAQGELGLVESGAKGFSAALRGPAAALEAPVTGDTGPTCRAQLGDARCGVAMAARRRIARVTGADGAHIRLDSAAPDHIYAAGMLRWLDGANAGLDSPVAASSEASVTLREPPAFAVTPGARVLLIEGCDRRFATCVDRFANAANFRGEPHLPGNDLLLRYGR